MKIFSLTGVRYVDHMNQADPSWLMSECIAGNEAAIETLVRQYETDVFRLALSVCNDVPEAYEITQESFIAVLRSLPSYQEKKSFKACFIRSRSMLPETICVSADLLRNYERHSHQFF